MEMIFVTKNETSGSQFAMTGSLGPAGGFTVAPAAADVRFRLRRQKDHFTDFINKTRAILQLLFLTAEKLPLYRPQNQKSKKRQLLKLCLALN